MGEDGELSWVPGQPPQVYRENVQGPAGNAFDSLLGDGEWVMNIQKIPYTKYKRIANACINVPMKMKRVSVKMCLE